VKTVNGFSKGIVKDYQTKKKQNNALGNGQSTQITGENQPLFISSRRKNMKMFVKVNVKVKVPEK
jgi:hypothetical protein